MRHRKAGKKLGRNSAQRSALFRSLIISLVEHGRLKTTLVKAKELRRMVEKLVTQSAEDTVARRRLIYSRIRNKSAVSKLFGVLGPQYRSRPGGYTRVLKCGFRAGDNAPLALIEFVEKE